jgi:mannose-1-phosphate guanylyltransferase/mannose-6-phosphate isomerase
MNCIILCGGSGSRLWPLSREKLPKQLLPIVNENTMLQNTVIRFKNLNIKKYIIICNKEHYFLVEKQLNDLKLDSNIDISIVTEPIGRDTCAAVAIGALLGNYDENSIVVPCDHVFDDNAFEKVVLEGLKYTDNSIVTFGITPTHPETGYGYIETNLDDNNTIQFIEKPNLEKATEYFNSGKYYWNAGVFIFKNKNMIECYKKYAPDILEICELTLNNSLNDPFNKIIHLHPSSFIQCRAISVDYAIMEKLCKDNDTFINKITIPYQSIWCDIGSFSALYDFLDNKDSSGNIINGDVLLKDTSNCYINSERSFVALVGVENLVVVNTRDALLICDKNKTQDVKKVVDELKAHQRIERIVHAKENRPWGWYCNIEGNEYSGFKVKRIAVYPGKKLSLQSHDKRSEHWVIVSGRAKVQVGHDFLILEKNQHVYIPKKTLHRMENIGDELLEFVETQIGEYLGEDDIIRYEDDFNRV